MALSIRLLEERDVAEADRIFRLAFGTFLGMPDPLAFAGDADMIRTRWLAAPACSLAAELDGRLAGSNFITRWGSVGFFGPLTVHPDHWGKGVAKLLLEAAMDIFDRWQITHAGLYTFSNSVKHTALYQKFDFWPRFLNMMMTRAIPAERRSIQYYGFAALSSSEKKRIIEEGRQLTDSIYAGLDVEREIVAVDVQKLGDTVLLRDDGQLAGLAVCHSGPGSEAGSGACYVKFGAVLRGASAGQYFQNLIDVCESYAASVGASKLVAGMNASRHEAYRVMLARGFQIAAQGLAMHRGDDSGYNHPGVYLIDDWR